jgi:type III secretory pathway component EscS
MVANLYVPLVMALWAIGVAYLVIVMVNLETRPLALWEATTSAVIALVAAVAIKALKIGARLKQYASEETTDARIIQLNPDAPEPKIPPGAGRAAA